MLPIGKLDSQLLEKLIFNQLKTQRDEVLVRPSLGEDCAVLDAEGLCILSTDPITGTDAQIGRLAVHINCNDIAAQGAMPLGLMLTILAPVGTTESQIKELMQQAIVEADNLGVEIIGGHTEITSAVNRMVVSGVAVGFKPKSEQPTRKVRIGDLIVMTKTAGLEGTGILAFEKKSLLIEHLSEELLQEAEALLNQISVVEEGVLASKHGALKLHDVTEGGLYGAVWELCEALEVGCVINKERIPVLKATQDVCAFFKLDPYKLISSGSMLVILGPENVESYMEALHDKGIQGTIIGEVAEAGRWIETFQGKEAMTPPEADELYKVVG